MNAAQLSALKPHIKGLVWHWTAGPWWQTFKRYHFCHTWNDGKKQAATIQTLSLWTPGSHVWRRNTGLIGLSMCGMWRNPVTGKFHAIQDAQVEQMARTSAELLYLFDLDPDTAAHDHVYWATIDNYGPGSGNPHTKVDIGAYEPIVRRKTLWYHRRLVQGYEVPYLAAKLF